MEQIRGLREGPAKPEVEVAGYFFAGATDKEVPVLNGNPARGSGRSGGRLVVADVDSGQPVQGVRRGERKEAS